MVRLNLMVTLMEILTSLVILMNLVKQMNFLMMTVRLKVTLMMMEIQRMKVKLMGWMNYLVKQKKMVI